VDNIRQNGPATWQITTHLLPPTMPMVIDNPEDYLPRELPQGDLLLSLGENPGVAELIPDIVKRCRAKGVIAPVDNRAWLPPGLARQIKAKLIPWGIEIIFPTPFCTLSPKDSPNTYIIEFATYFGKPEVKVDWDGERIREVTIIREAPCGNTRFVAKGLIGVRVLDAVERAGLLHHEHPCLTTMTMDREFDDTLMHRAGLMTKMAIEDAIKERKVLV